MRNRLSLPLSMVFSAGMGWASISPAWALGPKPEDCDQLVMTDYWKEDTQDDFLANYVALATSFSPMHGPVPHKPGHGSIGLDLAVIPPLGCGQMYIAGFDKFEDANKSPVVPRPQLSFAFPALFDRIVPYAGLGFVPAVPVGGTRNLMISAELGAGMWLGNSFGLSLRGHGTLIRTLGEIATPFEEGDPAVLDFYNGSSSGVDLLVGWEVRASSATLVPYLSLGLTEASTFFWVGDDGIVATNAHPYFGPAASLGVDALVQKHVRIGAEFYAAPGGHNVPRYDDGTPMTVTDVSEGAFSRYGHIYTGRLRLAWEL